MREFMADCCEPYGAVIRKTLVSSKKAAAWVRIVTAARVMRVPKSVLLKQYLWPGASPCLDFRKGKDSTAKGR
jgi:hypothetical protein